MRKDSILKYVLILTILCMLSISACGKRNTSSDAKQNSGSKANTEQDSTSFSVKATTSPVPEASKGSFVNEIRKHTFLIFVFLIIFSLGHLFIVKLLLDQLIKTLISNRMDKLSRKIDVLEEETKRIIDISERQPSDSAKASRPIVTNQFDLKPIEEYFRKLESSIEGQFGSMKSAQQRALTEEQQIQGVKSRLDDLNKSLELHMYKILSEIQSMKSKLDPLSDDRFMPLRVNFPENFPLISQAYYAMNKSKDSKAQALRSFIRDYAKIIGLHALSQNPEQLELSYTALREILKELPLELTLPIPGSAFDDKTMNQDKVYGESSKVFRIVYPGFVMEEHFEKALVDVK